MLLSNTAIMRHMKLGSIVIEPFDPRALGNVSYDLTLGEHVARYRYTDPLRARSATTNLLVDDPAAMFEIEEAREEVVPRCPECGPCRLIYNVNGSRRDRCHNCLATITETARGFYLAAGERVLAHSREIAGGRLVEVREIEQVGAHRVPRIRRHAVTTEIHATSTAARIGLSVCQCAGWGDVGYLAPWTLELHNHSPRSLWIPVGAVLAQVSFDEVEPILEGTSYEVKGSYQQEADPRAILAAWKPEMMLPKRLKVRP